MGTISGNLKWFNPSKGYGFIQSHLGDVMIHVSVLRGLNVTQIFEGDEFKIEYICSENKLRATRVIEFKRGSYVETTPHSPKIKKEIKGNSSDWTICSVKWFNRIKGFGFFQTNEGDAFVHMEILRAYRITELRVGEPYYVKYGASNSGLLISEIRPITR